MNFLDQKILSLDRQRRVEISNQMLVFCGFEPGGNVNIISPAITCIAKECFTAFPEMVESKFKHMKVYSA